MTRASLNVPSMRRAAMSAVLSALMMLAMWSAALAAPAAPKADTAKDAPYYVTYIKDPSTLGFHPNARLFSQIRGLVNSQHPDKPTADKLYAGVVKEVSALLTEAKVPATDLQSMPKNDGLPQAIEKRYSGKIDADLLWFAMIRGLLSGTGDPYSVLMPPTEFAEMMKRLHDESFAGVGIVIELDKENKNQLTVVEPLDGTPAQQAGLEPGDVITKIDGTSTQQLPIEADMAKIRGPLGSKVVLTIQRKGQTEKDIEVTRGNIQVKSVMSKMLPDNIGYVRLRVFGDTTGAEFDKAIDSLLSQGARGMIVDLRNNGGGFLTAATDVCSHFLKPGAVVTYTEDRAGKRHDEIATEGHTRLKVPVVLLVNNYSASASEITAGCLKDSKAATLIGVKTFGKGSVQQILPLLKDGGAALKLTVAHFFTPQGHVINKVGVQPDITVAMAAKDVGRPGKDIQLQKAVEVLTTTH